MEPKNGRKNRGKIMNNTSSHYLLSMLSNKYVQLASRVILGGTLMFAGILKLPYIDSLIWEIGQYQVLPEFAVTPYAYILPFAEIAAGLLLLTGVFIRASAAISGLMVASFTIAKLNAKIQGFDIDVCPCFGPMIPLFLGPSLAIDALLLISAIPLIMVRSEYLSLSGWLANRREK